MRTLGVATSLFDENENLTSREWPLTKYKTGPLLGAAGPAVKKGVFEAAHTRLANIHKPPTPGY